MTHYPNITDFLGSEDSRYFSQGFKDFDFDIRALECSEAEMRGTIRIRYSGLPRPGYGDQIRTHVGSMEYMAMAGMLAEHALVYLGTRTRDQVSQTYPFDCRFKLKKPLEIGEQLEQPFSCRLLPAVDCNRSLNIRISKMLIHIGEVPITLYLDHPGRICQHIHPEATWPVNIPSMHSLGYKMRRHSITVVQVYPDQLRCTASVKRYDRYSVHREGIGSAREMVLHTDLLSIAGQLMQVLLFTVEGITREQSPNIWLREVSISCGVPLWNESFTATVQFTRMDTVRRGSSHWQLVELECRIGQTTATFSVAHQLLENKKELNLQQHENSH